MNQFYIPDGFITGTQFGQLLSFFVQGTKEQRDIAFADAEERLKKYETENAAMYAYLLNTRDSLKQSLSPYDFE